MSRSPAAGPQAGGPLAPVPADEAARRRLETEFDRNLLVEAGAGSGKTESLARRMAAGVARGVYDVDHLAAVTFTRKAAAELRGRFLATLEDRLREALLPDEHQRLQAAIDGIERFFAGTIHSFCGRMLREHPVEARMAPGFTELDDVQDAHARMRAWHDYIAAGQANPNLLELLESGLKPKELAGAFRIICEHAEVTFDGDDAALPDPEPAWTALDAFWGALSPRLPQPIDETTTCKVQQYARLYPQSRKGARRHRVADLAALLQDWERHKKVTLNRWGNLASRGNAAAEQVRSLVDTFMTTVATPFLVAWRAHLYDLVVRALTEAREHYARDRRHRNLVNFGDLLNEATRLVRDVPSVRAALQARFSHVFVDEFQDTDPVQAELFLWLAAVRDVPPGATAWTAPLRPGALFIVGDPKQSIFRFRRADIEVYDSVKRRLVETGGDVVSLTANFRSRPSLCAFVNAACGSAFPGATTPEAPVYDELRAFRQEPSSAPPAVERLTIRSGSGAGALGRAPSGAPGGASGGASVRASGEALGEASVIADLIEREIAARRHVAGDYLILTRTRTHLGRYATALQAAQIPVEVSGASLFTASAYVAALVDVLACVADPSDGLALLRVLRGGLMGFTDEALFCYRQAGGRFEVFGAQGIDDDVAREIARLRGWQRRVRTLPVGAALEVILDESGWLAHAAAHPGGGEAGALLQAVDRARIMARTGAGLREIAASLIDGDDVSTDIEALPLEPGRDDVVRVMNIHRAKGLEAKVVILADPSSWRPWAPAVHIVRRGGRASGVLAIIRDADSFAKVALAEPRAWAAAAVVEAGFLDAEVVRLQYVAATRARERMIVVQHADPKDNKAWPLVRDRLGEAPEVSWPEALAPRAPAASLLDLMAVPPDGLAIVGAARAATIEAARQPSSVVTSVTDEVRVASAGLRVAAADQEAEDPTQVLIPDTASHRADTGRHWGALIHGLLEHAMRERGAQADDLARLARWLTVETPELRPHIPQAVALVETVAAAPFWAEARASGEVHVEVPFTRLATARDLAALGMEPSPVPVVMRGVIDLVHRAAEGWRVVDYKTDQARAADLGAKYAAQVTVYAHAWADASGTPLAGAAVYAVRDGVLVPVSPSA